MSESTPIKLYLFSPRHAERWFGAELGAHLRSKQTPFKASISDFNRYERPKHEWERFIRAESRGGMYAYAFGKLIEQSGHTELGFIGDLSCTHEIRVDLGDPDKTIEVLRFTVISENYDILISQIETFILWCKDNSALARKCFDNWGYNLDGSNFDTIIDAIDGPQYSLDPNFDYGNTCSGDGWYVAIGFSFLKTIIYTLRLAKRENDLVVIEHWGGIE